VNFTDFPSSKSSFIMSGVVVVGNRYAEPWFRYVELVARNLDDGRAKLVARYPTLRLEHSASLAVSVARTAKENVKLALRRRTTGFASRSVSRSGPEWDRLAADYAAACAAVHEVCSMLVSAIALLFKEERELPSAMLLEDSVRLSSNQRVILRRAQTQLTVRTNRFMALAQSVFIAGHSLEGSVASSSQESGTDQHRNDGGLIDG